MTLIQAHYAAFFVFSWANLTSPFWWFELYVHIQTAFSAFCKFVYSPFLEWAASTDGQVYISPDKFKRLHSIFDLISRYAALNARPNLPQLRDGGK